MELASSVVSVLMIYKIPYFCLTLQRAPASLHRPVGNLQLPHRLNASCAPNYPEMGYRNQQL